MNTWMKIKNISVKENVLQSLLDASIDVSNLSGSDILSIIGNPVSVLCKPSVTSKLFHFRQKLNNPIQKELDGICNLNVSELRELVILANGHFNRDSLQREFDELMNVHGQINPFNITDWSLFIKTVQELQNNLLNQSSFKSVMGDVSNILREYSESVDFGYLREKPSYKMKLETQIALLYRLLCSRKRSSIKNIFSKEGEASYLDEFRESMKAEKKEEFEYLYDETTSKQCNEIMQMLENDPIFALIWKQLKPLVRGKIVYTPDTPATRKIISAIEKTFFPIIKTIKIMELWTNQYSSQFRAFFLNGENQNFIEDLFTDDSEGNFIDLILNNRIVDVLNGEGEYHVVNASDVRQQVNEYFQSDISKAWAKSFDGLDELLENLSVYLSCFETDKFVGVSSEYELEKMGLNLIGNNNLWAGLVFQDFPPDQKDDTLPEFITYKIRMNSVTVDNTRQIQDRFPSLGPRKNPTVDLKYLTFGFAFLQDMTEHAIISIHSGRESSELPGISLQQMPYPCYVKNNVIDNIGELLRTMIFLSWIMPVSGLIKSIIYEKEARLKETMKAMGMGSAAYWMSFFLDSIFITGPTVVILTFLLTVGGVYYYANILIFFIFFASYGISTICFSFFVSTLFSKSNSAGFSGGIIFIVTSFPLSLMKNVKVEFNTKMVACLLSNVAFGTGLDYINAYEKTGFGIQWANFMKTPFDSDNFSLGLSIGFLWLDAFIYLLLAWYIGNVFPGEFGIPKPFHFPFSISYWRGTKPALVETNSKENLDDSSQNKKDIEEEPKHLPCGISVQNLHKVYPKGKVAVDDLSLNFYEDQITSFLGHNGAGKTTTINIITGLFPPSAGTIKVYGRDIQKETESVRRYLGICPQHNVLFQYLTVKEHFILFSLLKNTDNRADDPEIDSLISEIGLNKKKNAFPAQLSGGMKRKLCIGLALVGGSRVIILDEPTAGVDPFSRRSIWDILIRYKTGRTIILTTHFMDEADLLGDRIAIISEGKLITCGSSLFLRNRFGNGYYLTIDRYIPEDNHHEVFSSIEDEEEDKELNDCSLPNGMLIDDEGISDVSKVNGVIINPSSSNPRARTIALTKFIQKHIPDARLFEQLGSEILYLLPTEDYENSIKKFEGLFLELENHLKTFQIRSYGLSNTTMEEIFLTVVKNTNAMEVQRQPVYDGKSSSRHRLTSSSSLPAKNYSIKEPKHESNNTHTSSVEPIIDTNIRIGYEDYEKVDDTPEVYTKGTNERKKLRLPRIKKRTVVKHAIALFIKRFHQHRRDKKIVLAEIVIPFFYIVLSAMCISRYPEETSEPQLPLNPWIYPITQDFNTYTFYSNAHKEADWPRRYEEQLLSKIGMGDKCVTKIDGSHNCTGGKPDTSNFSPDSSMDYMEISPVCKCQTMYEACDKPPPNYYPPEVKLPSGDILQNLNGRNISDYLIKTRFEFEGKRFGGFEFGILNPLAGRNFDQWADSFQKISKATNMNESRVDAFTSTFAKEALVDMAYSSSTFDYIRVWFNNKGWASSVSYMNAVNNMVLRATIEEKSERMHELVDSSKYGIAAINHPMNYTSDQFSNHQLNGIVEALLNSVNILLVLSILPASYVLNYVLENNLKIKHLHFVYGVKITTYWITGYIFDTIIFCINLVFITVALIAIDASSLISDANFYGFATLIILYSLAIMPLMYILSFFFKKQSSALFALLNLNLMIGIIPFLTTLLVKYVNEDEKLYYVLETLFMIFPQFCLIHGLFQMFIENIKSITYEDLGFTSTASTFDWNYLGQNYLFLFFEAVIFFIANIMMEVRIFESWRLKILPDAFTKAQKETDDEVMDEDVYEEYQRVMNAYNDPNNDENALLVKELSKRYWRQKNSAVDKLSFGVRRGECFGLLGINGAGKTTTFKMLTGDINPTSGDAFINGYSIFNEMGRCRQSLGYCPQEDALHPLLTGREHLELYSRLRGVNKKSEIKIVNYFLKELGLISYCDQLTHTYSGGNKRKLCTAISLIGKPSTVFLDEPTSGMDPGSRRFLWNCVLDVIRGGQSVVLTSHSMEECEVLCSRLGIMVNGKFKCLGTAQHLKSRFGSGYSLTIRSGTTDGNLDSLKDFVLNAFPFSEIKEEHYNQLTYQIPLKTIKLSTIFHEMERAKSMKHLLLEDYSLTQTTLDEVFIRFASEQKGMSEDAEFVNDEEGPETAVETTAL
nr:phospholipid-transporting ATPase ABCA1-like [Lepeophtheirus salmonis]